MNLSPDTLRRAVELANGFEYSEGWGAIDVMDGQSCAYSCPIEDVPQFVIDALAAQLVRQVDALHYFRVLVKKECTTVCDASPEKGMPELGAAISLNRSENTINAIVDSGVLE